MLKETKIDAQRFLNEVSFLKDELKELTTNEEIKTITNIVNDLEQSLKLENRSKIQELVKNLDNATQKFSEKRIKKSIKSALVGKKYDNI